MAGWVAECLLGQAGLSLWRMSSNVVRRRKTFDLAWFLVLDLWRGRWEAALCESGQRRNPLSPALLASSQ